MQADKDFKNLAPNFWANVQLISQEVGYTNRRTKAIKVHSLEDMLTAMSRVGLDTDHIVTPQDKPTSLATKLHDYFRYRAQILDQFVEPHLMNVERAEAVYNQLKSTHKPTYPIPSSRQRGKAYYAGIINTLIEAYCGDLHFDYEPRNTVSFTDNGQPISTLSKRVDGCFTESVNPIALWHIKEYYYNKSFSSHIADSLYDIVLNGMEINAARQQFGIQTQHIVFADAHYVWWVSGRAYLCRLIDMLHMGYIDELIFGYEAVERLPLIVPQWLK